MGQQKLGSAQGVAGLQITEKKTCSKCKESLTLNNFYRSKSSRDGFQHHCKKCKRELKRKTESGFISDSVPDGKCLCRSCGLKKDATPENFYPSKLRKASKLLTCIPCKRSANRKAAKENINAARDRHKRWREQNREHVNSTYKDWKLKNKNKVSESNKSYMKSDSAKELRRKAHAKRYYKNPEKYRMMACAYDSRVRKSKPKWQDNKSLKMFYAIARAFGYEVDHIVPIKSELVCGLHCLDNFQFLTREQNASKGNRFWPDMPTGE